MPSNNNESFGFLSKKLARYYEVEIARVKSHLPKSPKVLEVGFVVALKRLLKPGGIILAKFSNGDSPLGMPNQNGDLTHKIAIGSGIIHELAKSSNMPLVLLKGNAEPFLGLGLVNFVYRLIIYPTRFVLNILFNLIFSANHRVNFCASNLVAVLKK